MSAGPRKRARTGASPHYRGRDRRGLIQASQPIGASYRIVAGLLLTVVLLIRVVGGSPLDPVQVARVTTSFDGAAFTIALAVASLCVLRWKLVGEAAALHLGIASGVYAAFVLGPGVVLDETMILSGSGPFSAGGRIVIASRVILALAGPEVDASIRPWRSICWAAAGVVATAYLATWAPGLANLLLTPGEQLSSGALVSDVTGSGVVVLWLLLGAWAVWRGHQRRRPLLAWFGLGWLVLAASAGSPLWMTSDGAVTDLGTVVLQAIAFLSIGTGAINELVRAFRDKDGRLLASVTSARAAEERLQLDLEAQRERTHEAHNVLAAIEAATTALERYRDQLDAGERAALSSSITSEVHRLQRLVEATSATDEVGRFRLSEAIAPLVTCMSTQVADVHVDVPSHLVVVGRVADTVQVLHNVLENARRYGGGRITIRATLEHARVVLRISDGGPGIAASDAGTIFERGVRGPTSAGTSGSGLGLFISRQLMREQAGELRLASAASDGGATFEIVLPGLSSLLDQDLDELQDLRQPGNARRRLRLVRVPTIHGRAPGRLQEDDPVGDVVAT